MPADNLQNLCSESREKLKSAISIMETFLNEHALSQLVTEQDEETVHFTKDFCRMFAICLCFLKFPMRSWVLYSVALILISILPRRLCIICITDVSTASSIPK